MGLAALLLVALALSVDNFTIALAAGAQVRERTAAAALWLPVVFAAFAAAAPVAGWYAGSQISIALTRYGSIVTCAILVYVGWRTLRSAWQSVNGGVEISSLSAMLALGLGTSMDSLTVGFALALAHTNVAALAAVNGAVCAVLSLAGLLLGERVGEAFPSQSKIAAGLVLILVGLRALLVHP